MMVAELAFWFSIVGLLATYVVYPLSMPLLARGFGRPHFTGESPRTVSLMISAFNEATVIRSKIENALQCEFEARDLEIVVVSDASDDGTDEIVQEYAGQGVKLRRMEPRRGKTRGLSCCVPEASGEIIVFSDANSVYDRHAIRALVRHFDDPQVGYVVGHQRYVQDLDSTVAQSEGTYWDIEVRLKMWEGQLSSVVGGDGAIYAIRKELFEPLADDDINDFVNPLQIVAKGFRGVFDPDAFCYESAAQSFEGEFRRKVRIVNRAFRGLMRVPQVLNPIQVGWFAYQVVLHKLLRWFTPYLLLGVLLSSLMLTALGGSTVYQVALYLQLVGYSIALLKLVPGLREQKLVFMAFFFVLSSTAALMGTISVLGGKRFQTWRPERS